MVSFLRRYDTGDVGYFVNILDGHRFNGRGIEHGFMFVQPSKLFPRLFKGRKVFHNRRWPHQLAKGREKVEFKVALVMPQLHLHGRRFALEVDMHLGRCSTLRTQASDVLVAQQDVFSTFSYQPNVWKALFFVVLERHLDVSQGICARGGVSWKAKQWWRHWLYNSKERKKITTRNKSIGKERRFHSTGVKRFLTTKCAWHFQSSGFKCKGKNNKQKTEQERNKAVSA